MEIEINSIKNRLTLWARTKPLIEKVYLFGSRLTGVSIKTGEPTKEDSDVDIAVEIVKGVNDENHLATWIFESGGWVEELENKLGLPDGVKLDMQLYHPVETPHIDKYLQGGAKVLYSSAGKRLSEVHSDLNIIYHHLDMFKRLNEIIDNNEALKNMDWTLIAWMKRAFTADLVVSIGRICDEMTVTNSLVQFLRELKQNPTLLKRENFVSLYESDGEHMIRMGHRDFDNLAGEGKDSFPLDIIDKDIKALTSEDPCKLVRDYRDKYVAHRDLDKLVNKPKYDDLFEAFTLIEKIFKKYNHLLKATSGDLTPMPQGNLWKALTIPWLDDKS